MIIDTANPRVHPLPWGLVILTGNIEIHPFLSLVNLVVAMSQFQIFVQEETVLALFLVEFLFYRLDLKFGFGLYTE